MQPGEVECIMYLQRHQQTLALHIREAEIDASSVTVGIAIPHDVFNLQVDFVN